MNKKQRLLYKLFIMTFVSDEQRDEHDNKLEEMTDTKLKKEEKMVYHKCTDLLHKMALMPEMSTEQRAGMRLLVSFLSLYINFKAEIEKK